ncbi:hypothetical protein SEA_SPEEDDEMON_690 [Gordonia phage SpeedDemon]|uniref:Uncharacterized protein n=1 Tax=Gordonia phage Bantam TaxID=1887641 RepID=A0A1B3AYC9_9CAUD|nr:hypothetical protein BIZ77_gp112 [Gordonia phage Bantam]AOE43756.1 hypothetical protein SEA_BANTAM_67 [Gordonia phage Bantam]QNL30519.1 hypothetical protein SEA_SPEEDDEMON_690 [Gordonia phage SpeedDemon]
MSIHPHLAPETPVTTLGEPILQSTENVDGELLFVLEVGDLLIDMDRPQAELLWSQMGALLGLAPTAAPEAA